MRNQWLSVAAAFAVVLGSGMSRALADSPDDTLEVRIEKRLEASKLGHVDVDVENGVATLKGEVATAGEKARAAKLAKVKGVTTVTNDLEVDADKAKARVEERAEAKKEAIDRQAEVTKETAEAKAEAKKEAIDRKTEATKEHVDKTGHLPPPATETARANEKVDPLISAKVKMKFAADDLVKAHQINVDSERDGVVTLRGTVPSETAHKRAVEIAKTTDGVRQVNDLLKVGPQPK
jgi:hyperosmotically inducible periplasmic protein